MSENFYMMFFWLPESNSVALNFQIYHHDKYVLTL
jgi:hypothetical protein